MHKEEVAKNKWTRILPPDAIFISRSALTEYTMQCHILVRNKERGPGRVLVVPEKLQDILVRGPVEKVGEVDPKFPISYTRRYDHVYSIGTLAGSPPESLEAEQFILKRIAHETGRDPAMAQDAALLRALKRYEKKNAAFFDGEVDLYTLIVQRPKGTRLRSIFEGPPPIYAALPQDGAPRIEGCEIMCGGLRQMIRSNTWPEAILEYAPEICRLARIRLENIDRNSRLPPPFWIYRPVPERAYSLLHEAEPLVRRKEK